MLNLQNYSENLQNVINAMGTSKHDVTTKSGLLKSLDLFNYYEVSALNQIEIDDEVFITFVERAAELIAARLLALQGVEYQLGWLKNKDLIRAQLATEYASFWIDVERLVETSREFNRLEKTIQLESSNQIRSAGAATIQTEADFSKALEKWELFSEKVAVKILNFDGFSIEQHESLISIVHECSVELKGELTNYLNRNPVQILFTTAGNGRVLVKVNLGVSSYSYAKSKKTKVRRNKGKDAALYPLIVAPDYIDDFLDTNSVRSFDSYVDESSITEFYMFYNDSNPKLSPSFLSRWFDCDCPTLYKYTPNLGSASVTMLGLPIPCFSASLIEVTHSTIHFDESITENELQTIIKYKPDTSIANSAKNKLASLRVSDGDLHEMKQFVNQYDTNVQHLINRYRGRIIKEALKNCGAENLNTGQFGLDCGFMNVYSLDEEYKTKREIIANVMEIQKSLSISFPSSQSITIQREMFNVASALIKQELGYNLYAETILD